MSCCQTWSIQKLLHKNEFVVPRIFPSILSPIWIRNEQQIGIQNKKFVHTFVYLFKERKLNCRPPKVCTRRASIPLARSLTTEYSGWNVLGHGKNSIISYCYWCYQTENRIFILLKLIVVTKIFMGAAHKCLHTPTTERNPFGLRVFIKFIIFAWIDLSSIVIESVTVELVRIRHRQYLFRTTHTKTLR